MSLFWRVLAANAAILIAGPLVLLFAPGPLHKHTADLVLLLTGADSATAVAAVARRTEKPRITPGVTGRR